MILSLITSILTIFCIGFVFSVTGSLQAGTTPNSKTNSDSQNLSGKRFSHWANVLFQLKLQHKQRGTKENPLVCAIVPLTATVPVHLAKLLLEKFGATAKNVAPESPTGLQNVIRFDLRALGKCFWFVNAPSDDLFGCLDLIQFADWIIMLIPSDLAELSTATEQLLTAIYANGIASISYAAMSSSFDAKQIKRCLGVSICQKYSLFSWHCNGSCSSRISYLVFIFHCIGVLVGSFGTPAGCWISVFALHSISF